jgi:AraC-like DNA-binding protein
MDYCGPFAFARAKLRIGARGEPVEKLFSSEQEASEEGFQRYYEISQREFFDGDLEVDGGAEFDIHLEKALDVPVSITHITSRSVMSYRRERRHIRGNRAGFKVVWIVRSGSVKFIRTSGTREIQGGQAGIVDSDTPFRAQHAPDGELPYDAYQIVIPPDVFFRHLGEAELFSEPFHLEGVHGKVIQGLIEMIVALGDSLARQTAHSLSLALLDAIGDHLRSNKFELPQRRKVSEQRLADVESFIAMHLTDPAISYEKVAASCGISARYLSYLLKANNTTFSELLWKNRLPKAREWLVSQSGKFSIHEIAYMSGFKSASHFSRKFKETYGLSPREYRAKHAAGE